KGETVQDQLETARKLAELQEAKRIREMTPEEKLDELQRLLFPDSDKKRPSLLEIVRDPKLFEENKKGKGPGAKKGPRCDKGATAKPDQKGDKGTAVKTDPKPGAEGPGKTNSRHQ